MTDLRSAFNNTVNYRTFRSTPHFLLPSINQQKFGCSEHCNQVVTGFPYKFMESELFIPKIETPRIVERGHDAATWLVGEKMRWQKKANILAKRYRNRAEARISLDSLHGKVLAGAKDITVPHKLATFLKHMSNDPDPEFCGGYNWYYCGGTLSVINWKKKAVIISAQGKYLDKIYLVPFKRCNGGWEECHSSAVTKSGPIQRELIYQIKTEVVKDRAVVGIRQRNAVAVYVNNPRRLNMELVEAHSFKIHGNEKPFTGIDLDFLKPGHFCNSHSDRTVKVWDPTCRTPVLEGKACRNINCSRDHFNYWCGIWYDKEDVNQIIVADNCCLTWFDVRCGPKTTNGICLDSSKQRLPFEMPCEELSLVVPSNYQHQLYLGTTHSLLQIDKRKPVLQPQPVRRWTHMLDGQLLMGHAVPLFGTNSEVLCVCCTQQVAMVVAGQICCSNYHPLALPHTPGNQGIVGLSFLPAPHLTKFDIITQTGNGNMYKYHLKHENMSMEVPVPSDTRNNKSLEPLLPEEKGRKLHATGRYSMHPIYLGLQTASKRQITSEETRSLERKQIWQKSKAELLSYVDVLAPGILDAWSVEEMQEWSTASSVPSAIDKVQQWLQTTADTYPMSNICEQNDNSSQRELVSTRCSTKFDSQIQVNKEHESGLKLGFASFNNSVTSYEVDHTVINEVAPRQMKVTENQILFHNDYVTVAEVSNLSPGDTKTPKKSKTANKRKSQVLGF